MTEHRTMIFLGVLIAAILLHIFNKGVDGPINGLGAAAGIAGL